MNVATHKYKNVTMGGLGLILLFTLPMLLFIWEGSWVTTLIVLGMAAATAVVALRMVLSIMEISSIREARELLQKRFR